MNFKEKVLTLFNEHEKFVAQENNPLSKTNGIFTRYEKPILTNEHVPVHWRYDLDEKTNPYLMERNGISCVFNAGAIEFEGKIYLMARVEGWDRKSFFALAESQDGIQFKFIDKPILLDQPEEVDVNAYDIRLVKHEDGFIYGVFCTERKDKTAPEGDTSSATAQCGILRTKDMKNFERLADLKTPSMQQRNVVLHPEFIDGKYAFYTRPQDGFIETGKGGGIGFGLSETIENAEVTEEIIIEPKVYHTIKEAKNGAGAPPIKTKYGWLHIAHGVRYNAAGLRYVLYCFMTDLNDPKKVIYSPGGYFIAPEGEERVGDVSNVVFCNGAVLKENGDLFIYYASSDTRMHVATTTIDKICDYVMNTPKDPLLSHECVKVRNEMIDKNLKIMADMEIKNY